MKQKHSQWRRGVGLRVIGVSGMRGAGKGVVAEVAKELGVRNFEMRNPVIALMKKRGIAISNRGIREFATGIRKEFGYGIVAKWIVKKLGKVKAKAVIVSGIRGPAEIKEFRKEFGNNFVLIGVKAPEKIRFERVRKRARKGDPRTLREFRWADRKEMGWGLGEAMESADYVIVNVGDEREVKEEVRELLRRILG